MNNKQKQKLKELLDKKLGGIKCLACGSKKCTFIDLFLSTERYKYLDELAHRHMSQMVGIGCKSCGYLMKFSTYYIGLNKDEGKGDKDA